MLKSTRRNPIPAGFGEFFAQLEHDPVVQRHSEKISGECLSALGRLCVSNICVIPRAPGLKRSREKCRTLASNNTNVQSGKLSAVSVLVVCMLRAGRTPKRRHLLISVEGCLWRKSCLGV